jgi:hypothetical protein
MVVVVVVLLLLSGPLQQVVTLVVLVVMAVPALLMLLVLVVLAAAAAVAAAVPLMLWWLEHLQALLAMLPPVSAMPVTLLMPPLWALLVLVPLPMRACVVLQMTARRPWTDRFFELLHALKRQLRSALPWALLRPVSGVVVHRDPRLYGRTPVTVPTR